IPGRPPDRGCHIARDRLEHPGVVLDAELAWDREEDRVRGLDGRVAGELRGDAVGLPGVGAAEAADRAAEPADLILVPVRAEQLPVQIRGDRHDAAADRDPWLALVIRLPPRLAKQPDLL